MTSRFLLTMRRVAIGFVACALPVVAIAVDAPREDAAPTPAPFEFPGDRPVDAWWQDFLDHGRMSDVEAGYATLDAVFDDDGDVVAARCTPQRAALDDAIRRVPVGIGLWKAAYDCAQAKNDEAAAKRYLAGFEALARYAVSSGKDGSGRPIRVISDVDVVAIATSGGLELVSYDYSPLESATYLVVHVMLFDTATKREHIMRFDYIDTLVRLSRDVPEAAYPAFRIALRREVITQLAGEGLPWATAARDVLAAMSGPTTERLAAFEAAGNAGHVTYATGFATLCFLKPTDDCAGRVIDTLLPFAEQQYSPALVPLAYAYLTGTGVARDEAAAMRLLDVADARLGDGKGTATLVLMMPGIKWPKALRERLLRLVESGSANAAIAYTQLMLQEEKTKGPWRPALEKHADSGKVPAATAMLGFVLLLEDDTDGAIARFESVAEDVHAVTPVLTALWQRKAGVDDARTRRWRLLAAQQGNADAMLEMAAYFAREPAPNGDFAQRKAWLQNAAIAGNVAAQLEYAGVVAALPPDDPSGGPATALRLLRAMEAEGGSPAARRALARLLIDGTGTPADPAAARALLLRDAEAGDVISQSTLGFLIAKGELPGERGEGRRWLRRAAKSGNIDASDLYAQILAWGVDGRMDGSGAEKAWKAGMSVGARSTLNARAWTYCVAPAAAFDARRAKEAGDALAKLGKVGWGIEDTKAACAAAVGDFATAVRLQRDAIATIEARRDPVLAKTLARFRERLAKYEAGERWTGFG